jgi:hypothetical protein
VKWTVPFPLFPAEHLLPMAQAAEANGLPSKVWPSTKPGFSLIGPQNASAIPRRQIIA